MGFLAPWLLGGLAVVGLPVWLHLLRRYKSTPRPFASLMFWERRTQSSIRHRRLKYRMLFALRALFVALLILAFARPFIESPRIAVAQGGRVVALLIDDSFSMRQGDRLDHAKEAALRVVQGLRGSDRAQVIVFGGGPTHIATNLTNDRGALESAIRSIQPGDGAASYAAVARAVGSLSQSTKSSVEAHLFSDMQKSSLPTNWADIRLPQGAQLVTHALASDGLPNLAVENVVAPRRVFDPKNVRIQASIASFGSKDEIVRVSLLLNKAAVGTKTATVPAGGRTSVEFLGLNAPYGLNRGEVRIDSHDEFPFDDHYYFAVERSDPSPVLFVQEPGDSNASLYFRTALESAPQAAFTMQTVSFAQATGSPLDRYACIVLNDPPTIPRGFEQALRTYVNNGGSLLVVLGRRNAGHVPVSDLPVGSALEPARSGGFSTIAQVDATHAALRLPARWDSVHFYRSVGVQSAGGRVLLRLDSGSPLLIESTTGLGRVMVFASALDNIDNDFPVSPLFVPFIQQVTAYLGRVDTSTGNYTAGAYYDLRPPGYQADSPIEVTGPLGERLLSLGESTRVRALPLEHEGFYDIHRQNGRHELAAVNPDRRESDFSIIPEQTIELWKNTGLRDTSSGGSGEMSNRRSELWWLVLLAALALAVAESLVGNRHLAAKEGAA